MLTTLLLATSIATTPLQDPPPDRLLTAAEASDFTATSTSLEVAQFVGTLDRLAGHLHLTEFGRSTEERVIPMMIFANPPVRTVEEARASGKLIAFIFANIHAGEVAGKEGLLMLARELTREPDHPWFEDMILVFVPNYNPDGNDRMSPDNRPGQVGPVQGMGTRPNAQGYDLNRDYIKLEAPESRAMVRFLNEWDPHISMDLHTTNGSRHRYTLTYDVPLNPASYQPQVEYLRRELLPWVTDTVRDRTGYELWYYGNFNRDRTAWDTYSSQARFGGSYNGLRGSMAILSEAYSYAPYRDRIIASREFVRAVLDFAAANHESIITLHEQARRDITEAGRNPQPSDLVPLRSRLAPMPELATVLGYVEHRDERGRWHPTDEPHDHHILHRGRFEPTLSVRRPLAYIIPPGHDEIIEKLTQHGLRMNSFEGEAWTERYRITEVTRSPRPFQGRTQVVLSVEASAQREAFPEGSIIVHTAQPLGTLLVHLLEPESEDGLVMWDFLGEALQPGSTYPIRRVVMPID